MENIPKIDFASKNFKFVIQYCQDILYLECTHINDFFMWNISISEPIGSSTSKISSIKWDLEPKILYKLFEEYTKGSLSPTYQFIFPDTYKTQETELVIELVMKLPHTDDTENKLILLQPLKISDFERCNRIFTNKQIETNKTIAKMQTQLDELERKLNNNSLIQPKKLPDSRIISGFSDGSVKIWDINTTNIITELKNSSNMTSYALSPHSKLIAKALEDKTIEIMNIDTNMVIQRIANDETVRCFGFSPDGKNLVSAHVNKIKIWDLVTGNLCQILSGHYNSNILSISFSSNGEYIISAGCDKMIRIWDAKNYALITALSDHTDWVRDVAISPNGEFIVSGSDDKTVKIWSTKTRQVLHTLVHARGLKCVVFSPDGKMIASGCDDGIVKIFNVETGSLIQTLTGHTNWVICVSFSLDGKTIVSGSHDKTIRIWNIQTGEVIRKLEENSYSIRNLRFL